MALPLMESNSGRKKSHRQDGLHVPHNQFTPRAYQIELLDVALQRNSIVCLGTGTGKTFIAVMLIKELAYQVRKPFTNGGKRSIFLVCTADLAAQQAKAIRWHTDLSIGEYIGAMGVDLWSKDKWLEELEKNHVLVMTHQIFLDMLLHGFVMLSQINLLVFDECHSAVGNHPYAQIMTHYVQDKTLQRNAVADLNYDQTFNSSSQLNYDYLESSQIVTSLRKSPAILGLTASVLNSKCKSTAQLIKSLQDLEMTLHSTAVTASDLISADSFGTKPEEIIINCDDYEDATGIVAEIEYYLDDTLSFLHLCYNHEKEQAEDDEDKTRKGLKLCRTALQECKAILYTLGPWCAAYIAQALIKPLAKYEDHEVLKENRLFLRLALTNLRIIHNIFNREFDQVQCLEDFHKYISPRVLCLLDIIRQYKPDDDFEITVSGDNDLPMDLVEGDDMSEDSFSSSEDEQSVTDASASIQQTMHYVAKKKPSSDDGSVSGNGIVKDTGDGILGIVFVERRNVALTLDKLLQELCNWDENMYFIRSAHIMGRGCKGVSKDADELYKKQEETLRKFRNKDINLLVATSVIEEGYDVPQCNLVVMFDTPKNYRSYVQSKGRARSPKSKYYLLINEQENKDFKEEIANYCEMEKMLVSKCRGRDECDEDEMDSHLADEYLPPYMPSKREGAARVTMSSAISLVNRYCAKLPNDAFTHLTPKSKTREVGEGQCRFVTTLQLPINSPIKKPITGSPMPRKKLAQMAVALKTCEILHKEGELDDHLLPVGKEVLEFDGDDEEWDCEDVQGQTRPGTTKRKQYYFKKSADLLVGDRPTPNKPCNLYFIKMSLTSPISEDHNTLGRPLYPPEGTKQSFGLLMSKTLPNIPLFPVFTRSGEVTVSTELLMDHVRLTKDKLEKLSNFQRYIFNKVLRLEKDPMTYDYDKADCSYLIVPLNKGDPDSKLDIDWPFVNLIQTCLNVHSQPARRDDEEKFQFKEEVFRDAVVMPSYRNIDKPRYFYVAEVRYDLNPRSPFPSQELYHTFEEYYCKKYGLVITNPEQPLLDVDHTSARLNLLTPRYMNQKGVALPTSSAQTKRAKREQKQVFIPELCGIHPFPASLWRKVVCLPNILYRMNYLLVAEEKRVQIAREAKIGKEILPEGFQFPKLDFGFSTKPNESGDQLKQGCDDSLQTILEDLLHKESELNHANPSKNRISESVQQDGVFDHHSDSPASSVSNGASDSDSLDRTRLSKTTYNPCDLSQISDKHNQSDDEITSCDRFTQVASDYDSFTLGPSPCLILQALTMSNANDFFNLERLETIGDSFLKFAITAYLYCSYPGIHEGKLSYLRSKQVSNFNLYRLGKRKGLAECMVSAKFEPTENWLPPGYIVKGDPRLSVSVTVPVAKPKPVEKKKDIPVEKDLTAMAICQRQLQEEIDEIMEQSERDKKEGTDVNDILIPYNLQTQHSLPDKSVADCVEALIGCYLTTCGRQAALQFMSWLGLKVLPKEEKCSPDHPDEVTMEYKKLTPPPSPLLNHVPHSQDVLEHNLKGFESFEEKICYKFRDRAYLLQAFTHASYHYNNITDCYQRLEFLGDAILDYVITGHLFEDPRKHSPGVLTDLRSALVNNNIFAALAVKWEFHKYFKAVSPQLFNVIQKFVEWRKEKKNDEINVDEEFQDIEDEEAEGEDIETPKALGDIFESVAGAIYLDSGMSLDTVWKVYYRMMKPQIEMFTANVPMSPVRELLEMEPERAKFEKPERTFDGKIRVKVNVFGKGEYTGVGRNYRIAKSAAAKRALKSLKAMRQSIEQQLQLQSRMMFDDDI